MRDSIILGLISLLSILLGSLVTALLNRRKVRAEIEKMAAETDKTRLEIARLTQQHSPNDAQSHIRASPTVLLNIFPATLDSDSYAQISQRVMEEAAECIKPEASRPLFQLPPMSEKITYILQARREIELRIRDILLDTGGGWAGSSMTSTGKYLELLHMDGIITDETLSHINEFYFFTTPILYSSDVDDDSFLTVQYIARELIAELDRIKWRHVPRIEE